MSRGGLKLLQVWSIIIILEIMSSDSYIVIIVYCIEFDVVHVKNKWLCQIVYIPTIGYYITVRFKKIPIY